MEHQNIAHLVLDLPFRLATLIS